MISKIAISSSCICYQDNGIWFVHAGFPLLFHYNLKEDEFDLIKVIPNEPLDKNFLFRGIYANNKLVILIPCNSCRIIIYKKFEDAFECINIVDYCENMFRGIIKKEKWLYLIPYNYCRIVRLDLDELSITYCQPWKGILEKEKVISSASGRGDKIYFTIWNTNRIYVYNCKTGESEMLEVLGMDAISNVVVINEYMYIYNMSDRTLKKYDTASNKIVKDVFVGARDVWLYRNQNSIILSFGEDNIIKIYDLDLNEKITEREEKKKLVWKNELSCIQWTSNKNVVYGIDSENNLISLEDDLVRKKEIFLDTNLIKKIGDDIAVCSEEKLFREVPIFDIGNYINYMLKNKNLT